MATPQPSANGSAKALQIYQGPAEVQKFVDQQLAKFGKYNATNAIVIAPQIEGFVVPAHHVPSMTVVKAEWTKNGDWVNSDDIYPQAGGKFSLLKHMIERISEAAGVNWDVERCRMVVHPNRDVEYWAAGTMQAINGQIYKLAASKLVERQTDLDEVTLAVEARHRKCVDKGHWSNAEPKGYRKAAQPCADHPGPGTPGFDFLVKQDMLQKDKHRGRMAESKAKLAALRERLNLKSAYTLQELAKPFVIPRLTFQPDFNDPEVRKMASAQAMGLTDELYGHPASRTPQLPPAGEDDIVDSAGIVHAPRPRLVEPDQETPQDPGPASDPQPEPAAADASPAAPTAISTPPVAGAVPQGGAAPVTLSESSRQLVARIRDAAEKAVKRMPGEITVPQLELLQKYLKGNERLVAVFFPETDALGELHRNQASAIADWLLNSTKDERHAFADDVKGQTQEGLPLA